MRQLLVVIVAALAIALTILLIFIAYSYCSSCGVVGQDLIREKMDSWVWPRNVAEATCQLM
jgi:hypothetical protein